MRATVALVAIAGTAIAITTSATSALAPAGRQASSGSQGVEPKQTAAQQTIRLESVDGRVRIRLEGPETWSIDATGFDVVPDRGGIRFRAQPVDIHVQTAGTDSVAQQFELTVLPVGALGFEIRNMYRRQK